MAFNLPGYLKNAIWVQTAKRCPCLSETKENVELLGHDMAEVTS